MDVLQTSLWLKDSLGERVCMPGVHAVHGCTKGSGSSNFSNQYYTVN
jgi:hypothetical protein